MSRILDAKAAWCEGKHLFLVKVLQTYVLLPQSFNRGAEI